MILTRVAMPQATDAWGVTLWLAAAGLGPSALGVGHAAIGSEQPE